ncbi:hypothetical protein GCM10023085_68030 [Actinomadura viridis]|uniref:Uncharacterized protein n=1 Tax=Actinomadura viridis TaxID=58110 RepID=A0A931GII7_9ACTN|nr:DUF6069 family protein [Actinomadura viridis]MBG6088340.1 hypothetical protein [Actinomadura viridis]
MAEVQDVRGAGARRRGRAVAVGAAVLANAVVWLLSVPAAGLELAVTYPGEETATVGAGIVLFFTAGASLAGWGLLAVLELVARSRARIVWTVVALAVLVLSFSPLLQVEAAGSTKAVLAIMHVVVAAVLVPGFWRTGPRAVHAPSTPGTPGTPGTVTRGPVAPG